MSEFIREYFGMLLGGTITGGLAGFFAWFWKRKSSKADYSKSIIDLYQEALTDLKNQYEGRYVFLKNEYDLKFANLNLQLEQVKKDQEMWKNKYSSLKKEFDAYKKKHQ
jgi:hypothetical protein